MHATVCAQPYIVTYCKTSVYTFSWLTKSFFSLNYQQYNMCELQQITREMFLNCSTRERKVQAKQMPHGCSYYYYKKVNLTN